jgi:hypothetical protein
MAWLGTGVGAAAATGADEANTRFFGGIGPLEAEQQRAAGIETNASAGLFVGVNQFDANSGLAALEYAVDDAVSLARAFVVDLRLLSPRQTTWPWAASRGPKKAANPWSGCRRWARPSCPRAASRCWTPWWN